MRNWFTGLVIAPLSLFVISSVALAQNAGRPAAAASSAPFDPRDFSGIWGGQQFEGPNRQLMRGEPPMTPESLAQYKSEKTIFSTPMVDGPENTDPMLKCEPASVPRVYALAHVVQLAHTAKPNALVFLHQAYRNYRIVYLDGRKHPSHPEGTWFGDSIGRWEGNTLVIETINFNGRSWIDAQGHPTSDRMKLTERITRTDATHLRMEVTIDDPGAYTRPWGGTITWTLQPADRELQDFLCSPADEAFFNNLVRNPADK